ncbi:MAG: LLM class flavin-dependent oxidoreductase [Thaumarchaeota archaeon]|nr:LLM class flavin-dependent oxidoreductase [Nitrososphaerota archaeon]
MTRKFGVKFLVASSGTTEQILAASRLAEKNFSAILFTDNLGYRSTWVLLGAIAPQVSTNLGVSGTWLYSRNPVDTAAEAATVAELMKGSEFQLGITPGNRIVVGAFARTSPVNFLREAILVLRSLLSGEIVEWTQYPTLSQVTNYSKIGKTKMFFAPTKSIPIMLSSVGPKLLRMAGEVAEGVFFDSQQPNQGLIAISNGLFDEISGIKEIDEGRKISKIRNFTRVYGISISVSRDSRKAKNWAKQEAGAVIASKSDELLKKSRIDMKIVEQCRRAQDRAGGFEGTAEYVPDALVDSMIINGTPKECVDKVAELVAFAEKKGFTEFTFIAPLGPDVKEAVQLLGNEILPSL